MSDDFTDNLELSGHPDDLWKSRGWLVTQLRRSSALTRWSYFKGVCTFITDYSWIYMLYCRWD